jgi:hypothetical protein
MSEKVDEILFGRDVRDGLLRLAVKTRDYENDTLSDWMANIDAYLRGHLAACTHQRDVVRQVSEILGWEPGGRKMLLSRLVMKVDGNWSESTLARAIDEYGDEVGVEVEKTDAGHLVVVREFPQKGKKE